MKFYLSDFISDNWFTNLSASLISGAMGVVAYSGLSSSAQKLEMISNALTNFNEVAQAFVDEYTKNPGLDPTLFNAQIVLCGGMTIVLAYTAIKRNDTEGLMYSAVTGIGVLLIDSAKKLTEKAKTGDISGLNFLYFNELFVQNAGRVLFPMAVVGTSLYGYAAVRQLQSTANNPGKELDDFTDKTLKAITKNTAKRK